MRKALIVWGGWDGHEPEQCSNLMESLLRQKDFEVVISDTLDAYLDKELMASLHLIVPIWTMGEITNEQEQGLLSTIRSGCGLAGWHGGMCDAFRNSVEYQFMTGGQWVIHPGGIINYRINITNHDHPITNGLSDFDMVSEQYYLHVDPSNDILATTTFSGEHQGILWIKDVVMPQIWTRMYGHGRIFYSGFGHVLKDFDVPEVRTIIERGMLWAARKQDEVLRNWGHKLHTLD